MNYLKMGVHNGWHLNLDFVAGRYVALDSGHTV